MTLAQEDTYLPMSQRQEAESLEDRIYVGWLTSEISDALRMLVHNSISSGHPLPDQFEFSCAGISFRARIVNWEGPRTMLIRVLVPLCQYNAEIEVAVHY
jgi:hypothetical protein